MAFPFMQQVGFNQKQSPLKVYEEAICFRNERQGEVSGLKRFNIGYTDESGQKCPSPVILHVSSFGSIERTLCAILENIGMSAQLGKLSSFTLWLSPTQVRIIPVSDRYVLKACEISQELTKQFIRCDVDDRNITVGRKVRESGRDWIPYSFVFGEKEESSMIFPVRNRYGEKDLSLSLDDLIKVIKERMGHMPFRPLSLSSRLSLRHLFL